MAKTEQTEINQYEGEKQLGIKVEKLASTIGKMPKDGTNNFSKYKYISNEALMAVLSEKLASAKLSIRSSVLDYVERDYEGTDNNGNPRVTIRTIITMQFRIIDLDTGYFVDEQFTGAEQDTGGKSMQQAITQCTKYFLFKLFKISTQDEQDPDANTNTSTKPTKAKTSGGTGGKGKGFTDDGKPWLNPDHEKWQEIVVWVATGHDINKVRDKYGVSRASFGQLKKDAEAYAQKIKDQDN